MKKNVMENLIINANRKELEKGKRKLRKRCERYAAPLSSGETTVFSRDISCETSESESLLNSLIIQLHAQIRSGNYGQKVYRHLRTKA